MERSRPEEHENIEENKIKDVRNLFRLQKLEKETTDAAIKGLRNLFKLEKVKKGIKDRIIRDVRNPFEHEEKNYYKPAIVCNFCSNNYIEYKSKGDTKTLSVEEYNKIKPYIKHIPNNLKKSET